MDPFKTVALHEVLVFYSFVGFIIPAYILHVLSLIFYTDIIGNFYSHD